MSRSQATILTNMCLIEDGRGNIVMQIRDPKRYYWSGAALPGGHIEAHEGLVESVIREVKEETNLTLENVVIFPVGVYEGNNRDPRDSDSAWSKSHAFFYRIPQEVFEHQKEHIRGLDDAEDVDWKSIEEIKEMKLAFDHGLIINDALNLYLNKKLKIK